jgi:hypothetical protein
MPLRGVYVEIESGKNAARPRLAEAIRIPTARGGSTWTAVQVSRVLDRLAP